jgi:hypothetical protein
VTAEVRMKNHEITLPLRLQAYERMVLFLERINPMQLLIRVKRDNLTPAQFHSKLVQSIKEEYDHNITQQIYLSPEAWNHIRSAREEIVRIINTTFITMSEKSDVNDLAKKILEEWGKLEKNPVQGALDHLKSEVSQLFK